MNNKIADLKRKFLTTKRYREWKKAVISRYKKCRMCGSSSCLVIDFYPTDLIDLLDKLNLSTIEEILNSDAFFDIKNGRTLCNNCNYKINMRKENKC